MKLFSVLSTLSLSLLLSLSGSTAQEPTTSSPPPSDKVDIALLTVNGSGCPPGSATIAVSPDNTAFTVTYSKYMAAAGFGVSPMDGRKNCQLALRVRVPQGFTYAVVQADYRGYASLAQGARGLQRANYYFQGQSATAFMDHPLEGPYDDSWQNTDKTDAAATVFAPCGELRNLNINTELRVNKGTADPNAVSYMSMDSTDGDIKTIYRFQWKQC